MKRHAQCRRDFTSDMKLNRILKQQTQEKEEISNTRIPSDTRMRRKSKKIMKEEKCFACDEKTKRKKRSRYLETLSRVERDDGSATLIDAMKKNEDLSNQWLHSAAKRLKVMTSSADIFSADVFDDQSCHNRFVYSYEEKSTTKTEMIDEEISVLSAEKEFKILIKRKILIQKNCYLLTDLAEEMANLYEIYCVERKVDDNKKMKSFLLTNFRDNLQFTTARGIHGNPIIVHSVEVNPVDYAMTLIIGTGSDHPSFCKYYKP